MLDATILHAYHAGREFSYPNQYQYPQYSWMLYSCEIEQTERVYYSAFIIGFFNGLPIKKMTRSQFELWAGAAFTGIGKMLAEYEYENIHN